MEIVQEPKSLAILGSYPNTDIGVKVLKQSIESLKDHFDILLSTHYPVDKEIQQMVKYYIYDHRNEKLKHEFDTYTWWWGSPELYVHTEGSGKKENHHYACYRLITNAIEFIKDYYEDFYYIEGDCIFHPDDVIKLKKMKEDSLSNDKKASFFTIGDDFFTALAFWSKMDFYVETISVLKTAQEFSEYTGGKNSLEKFYAQEIKSKNKLSDIHMMRDISSISYFDKSKMAQMMHIPSGNTVSANYRIVLVRQTLSFPERKLDTNNIYFVFSGKGYYDTNQREEIHIKIDKDTPFVLNTGDYCYWKQIVPTSDKILVQHNGIIDEYSVDEILSDTNSFIIFNNQNI